jgi:hypothetical protein
MDGQGGMMDYPSFSALYVGLLVLLFELRGTGQVHFERRQFSTSEHGQEA